MLMFDSKESILQSRRSRNHSSGWDWETAHKFLKDAKRVQHICSKATVKLNFAECYVAPKFSKSWVLYDILQRMHARKERTARTEMDGKMKI